MAAARLSGGCQCGAVRFRVSDLGRASICHCRMCQKAFGSFFGPLVTAATMEWTRGAPKWFASSNRARRGFCANCGSPLCAETRFGLEVAIGVLDAPGSAAPSVQVNPRDKLSLFDGLTGLPVREPIHGPEWSEHVSGLISYQHPDHDTDQWPPQGVER